jgi:hypothetical protein
MNNTNPIHRTVATLKMPHPILTLIALAKAVVQALTGNTSFPNPDPPLATVTSAIADLEAAQAVVQTRAKGAVQARATKRAALVALLHGLLAYVQKVADANLANAPQLIASAGMGTRKVAVRPPRVFAAKHGSLSGSVSLVSPTGGKRVGYEWQYSADGGKTWQEARATLRADTTVTGLVPGSTYLFRGRVVDKTGDTDWCPPVSLMVQ